MIGTGDSYLLMRGSVFSGRWKWVACLKHVRCHRGCLTGAAGPEKPLWRWALCPGAKVGSGFLSLEWMGIPSDDLNVKTCPELVSLKGPEGSRFLGKGTLSWSGIVGIHRKVTKMDLQNIYKPTGAIKPHPVSNYNKSKTWYSKNKR